jgi:hypothetical protein
MIESYKFGKEKVGSVGDLTNKEFVVFYVLVRAKKS